MQILPAIDMKDHKVVRLSQGKMGSAKVYADDVVVVAEQWVGAGAKRLHLVDLNGAFEAKPVHFDEVTQIKKRFPQILLEIGGGIRDLDTIQRYKDAGIDFCILGTVAVKNPKVLEGASKKFPHQVILGLDAKNGWVATEGWDDVSQVKAADLVQAFSKFKIESVIFTDVAKDGMMQGMNLPSIAAMAEASPFPIIASGGFTRLEDVRELKKIKNVMGVIAGKALYEGLVDLKEAIQEC